MADKTQQRSLTAATTHIISIFFISLQVGLSHHGLLYGRIGQLIAYFVLAGNGAVSLFVVFSMVSRYILTALASQPCLFILLTIELKQ